MSALRRALRDLPETVFADLLERDDGYLVIIDVPGVSADTVDVRLSEGMLHVQATRVQDVPDEFEYRKEGRSPTLDFEIPVPADATEDGATASIEQGVLKVRLPRHSGGEETTIPVESS